MLDKHDYQGTTDEQNDGGAFVGCSFGWIYIELTAADVLEYSFKIANNPHDACGTRGVE